MNTALAAIQEAVYHIEAFKNYAPNPVTVESRRADYMLFLLSMQSMGLIENKQVADECKLLIDMLHDKLQKVISSKQDLVYKG
jgi:hypothetical protein